MLGGLRRKGLPAATRIGSVGIVEREPPVFEAADEVHFHAEQVNGVSFVHHDGQAADFKVVVVVLGQVESQYIRKTGATTALDAHAKAIVAGDVLLLTDAVELRHRAGREHDGGLRNGNIGCVHKQAFLFDKIVTNLLNIGTA